MEEEIETSLSHMYRYMVSEREIKLSVQSKLSQWNGTPISLLFHSGNVMMGVGFPERPAWALSRPPVLIDSIIENADLTLCLTSKHRYIRECKKWFEAEKLKRSSR